ncbi:MAG: hypothetical protein JSW08_03080 [archaeon]|nr:MAG: hypothetical protein JSW08_03080 [archaeon]
MKEIEKIETLAEVEKIIDEVDNKFLRNEYPDAFETSDIFKELKQKLKKIKYFINRNGLKIPKQSDSKTKKNLPTM